MLNVFQKALQEAGRSHLFQRVASFLLSSIAKRVEHAPFLVLISFREWLHSYLYDYSEDQLIVVLEFSSLSESGFIPTVVELFRNNTAYWKFSSLSESGFIPTDFS